jgi:hypothetical protein
VHGIHFCPLYGTAEDAVGNNDATLRGGATFAPGKNGQAVDTGAALLDTATNYIASAWMKLNKADGASPASGRCRRRSRTRGSGTTSAAYARS